MIRVSKIQIPELPTQKPRRLYVYLPKDYARTDRRYPVLYMFDGHNIFYGSHATYGKSWGMKEYLECTKLPFIVAAVECNPEGWRRLNEYSPWDLHIPNLGNPDAPLPARSPARPTAKPPGKSASRSSWISCLPRKLRCLQNREAC